MGSFFTSLLPGFLQPYDSYLFGFGLLMIVVHVIEFLVLKIKYENLTELDFIQTLLFGFAHWLPIIKGSRPDKDPE